MILLDDKVGDLLKRYDYLDEIFFQFTDNENLVYDEAEYTLVEFCEMTGADSDDLIRALQKAISTH